jgi:hypothetical protein
MIGWGAYPEERDSDVRGSGPALEPEEAWFEPLCGMF